MRPGQHAPHLNNTSAAGRSSNGNGPTVYAMKVRYGTLRFAAVRCGAVLCSVVQCSTYLKVLSHGILYHFIIIWKLQDEPNLSVER